VCPRIWETRSNTCLVANAHSFKRGTPAPATKTGDDSLTHSRENKRNANARYGADAVFQKTSAVGYGAVISLSARPQLHTFVFSKPLITLAHASIVAREHPEEKLSGCIISD